MTTTWIGCGANLGDRESNIRQALEQLDAAPGLRLLRVSSLRETDPVGGPMQPNYLNGVAEFDCALSPRALLELCKACERDAGRDFDGVRDGPRPLDLDILAMEDLVVDTRDLIVPHPRAMQRAFVLDPLRELDVDLSRWPERTQPAVLDSAAAMREQRRRWAAGGCVTGVVPTMGALHAGHASLFERARVECDRVVATIFVNPLQFDDSSDLDAYPRTFEADLDVCRAAGVDAVYVPRAAAMYPDGFASHVAVGFEAEGMEGALRQGHFGGVATVVAKLLISAGCDRGYFGEKDAQQLAVIRRLVADFGIDTEVVGCPIVREADGLAMSSRNVRLGAKDRRASLVLSRALRRGCEAFDAGERSSAAVVAAVRSVLADEPLCAVEYVELRGTVGLEVLKDDRLPEDGARLLVAAGFDHDSECATRLIDNMVMGAAASTGRVQA